MDEYQIKSRPFLARWIMYSVFVWPMAIFCLGLSGFAVSIIAASFQQFPLANPLFSIVRAAAVPMLGATVGYCVGLLQRGLLRQRLYWAADHWRAASTAGGAIGAVAVLGLLSLSADHRSIYGDDAIFFWVMPLFALCLSAAQALRLRHAVRAAWLWVVGNLAGGMVFSGFVFLNEPDFNHLNYAFLMLGLWLLATAAQGAITGQIMLHLFQTQLLPMQPENASEAQAKPQSVWDEAI